LELEIEGDLLASILRPDTAGGRRASEGRQSSRKNIEKGVAAVVVVVIRSRESSRSESEWKERMSSEDTKNNSGRLVSTDRPIVYVSGDIVYVSDDEQWHLVLLFVLEGLGYGPRW
jgi:hypothetical protein